MKFQQNWFTCENLVVEQSIIPFYLPLRVYFLFKFEETNSKGYFEEYTLSNEIIKIRLLYKKLCVVYVHKKIYSQHESSSVFLVG